MAPSLTVCESGTPFDLVPSNQVPQRMSLVGRLLGRALGMPPVRTPGIGTLLMRR
jgi:hypothetical protein